MTDQPSPFDVCACRHMRYSHSHTSAILIDPSVCLDVQDPEPCPCQRWDLTERRPA
jgi:hypothetical protein